MKTKNRVISGLIISAILASGLFAVNGEIDKKDGKRKGEPSCMMEKEKFHKGEKGQRGESHIFGIFNINKKCQHWVMNLSTVKFVLK